MTAQRLQHIEEYYFSKKLQEIRQLQAQGRAIINLGIGSPDLPPPKKVRKVMAEYALQNNTHRYQSYRGHPKLRKAIAKFYKKHYGVKLSSQNQVLPLTGSKEGILHLSMALLNPGDQVLIPDPGYMTYRSATLLAEAVPVTYNLTETGGYFPNLKKLKKQDLSKVKLMWINYPHMPTGTQANKKQFEKLVNFARRHKILLINDNPYSFILTDKPRSILQIEGAIDVAIELNSLSKSHNMAGWRIGMMLGQKKLIDNVMKFKSQMDSGMFLGTQMAAIEALHINNKWYKKLNKIYEKRKKIAEKICRILNLKIAENQSGMFLWAKLPQGENSKDFTDKLLAEKDIFIAPGFIFGQNGNNYVRISLTNDEKTLQKALKRIDDTLRRPSWASPQTKPSWGS